jgi:murein DD-endopeptidase MepM/ murein hydrolase activator NlpD
MVARCKFVLLLFLLVACQSEQPTPFAVTIPATQTLPLSVEVPTAVPTARPFSTRTPTLPPTGTFTPSPLPSETLTPTITYTPSITFTPSVTPPETTDHYVFQRPISRDNIDYLDRTYPYGSTQGGNRPVHLGVDFVNRRFTPILAAAAGKVFYAGTDSEVQFGPQTDYYGIVVVIQHDIPTAEGLPLFTLYGHMQQVEVRTGQRVNAGQEIGLVGATGVAIGPHLHFEVRIGDPHDFHATRNPDLWIRPYPKFGTLAGRVTDSTGALVFGQPLQVHSADKTRYASTYADESVNSDFVWHENFTLGDLPEGEYEVTVSEADGRVRFRQTITVKSLKTTWIDVVLG